MDAFDAYDRFRDGELSLAGLVEVLMEDGHTAREVREMLSDEVKYPIPINYFGLEG